MLRGILIAVTAITCSACSVIKDSKEMKGTLGDLNRKGDELAKRISDVEQEATFDRSYKSFQEETEKLFAENGKDDVVESDMVIHAQAAISSMLFQFWKGDYADNLAALDNRFALHADMFFARVNGKADENKTVDVGGVVNAVAGPSRGYKGVAALGAFMHVMRPEYAEALKKNNLPRLSLYDVTIMALKARNANGPQPLLPKTMDKVLEWKQEAVYTLQLRHNFLPLMVAARLANLKVRGEWFANPRLMLDVLTGMDPISLNKAEPKKIDDRQLKVWIQWLKGALETRQQLRALGFEPAYNRSFGTLLNALNFGQAEILRNAPTSVSSERARMEYEFTQVYVKVASEMGSRLSVPDYSPSPVPGPTPNPQASPELPGHGMPL